MHRITPDRPQPLFDIAATRRIEQRALAALAPHTLMQRAGLAVARLSMALAPHARTVWLACGPGNNGGDGLEAAMHLQQWGKQPVVTWLGTEATAPPDARASLQRARAAGVRFADDRPDGLGAQDLCVDALLGIGIARPPQGRMAMLLGRLADAPCPVLAVDVPTGLQADTGQIDSFSIANIDQLTGTKDHFCSKITLTFLTLKPGLFTGHGRDAAGEIWVDDLGVADDEPPTAGLAGRPAALPRLHASHKGQHGDVAFIGGEGLAARGMGMTGAAVLAATAALQGGAGRVLLCLLDDGSTAAATPVPPELMLRRLDVLDLRQLTVVCGCGGGDAVRAALPAVLSQAPRLVLDADALNAIAADTQLQTQLRQRAARRWATVLTPHPLEAARLLGFSTAQVQADRLAAARALAVQTRCTVVLKGSGTVVAAPDALPVINPTGNGRLATAGTGDVLAGLIGARLAGGLSALEACTTAVWLHGAAADAWPEGMALTAGALARRLQP
ncbi:MAG: NAD(P)H-hydrate dehydratase [Burkholderiaceae bacterium]|nr:NAD(P)H-hydrate dehydratase [Burkholderiaceae bacterium]MDZ4143542.1 NAD(P)H-hydrate dehydratase [Burkholderiales bacterium]